MNFDIYAFLHICFCILFYYCIYVNDIIYSQALSTHVVVVLFVCLLLFFFVLFIVDCAVGDLLFGHINLFYECM